MTDFDEGYETPSDAFTLTIVRGIDADTVVTRLLGPHPESFASFDDAIDWSIDSDEYDRVPLTVGQIGTDTFVWEENGFYLSLQQCAAYISAGGQMTSVFVNVNGVMRFVHAIDGKVVRTFEPGFRTGELAIDAEGDVLPEELRVQWPTPDLEEYDVDPVRAALQVQALIYGTPLPTRDWLEDPSARTFGTNHDRVTEMNWQY
jgi:hypothetical protein